jgi:hypothetical protein
MIKLELTSLSSLQIKFVVLSLRGGRRRAQTSSTPANTTLIKYLRLWWEFLTRFSLLEMKSIYAFVVWSHEARDEINLCLCRLITWGTWILFFISRLRSEKVRSDQEVNDPFEEPDSTRVRVRLIRFSFDNTY